MKKFEIKKNSVEVSKKNRLEIKAGISLTDPNDNSVVIATFDTLEDAKNELEKYKSSIVEFSGGAGSYYLVEEFYIEENSYDDEDGELLDGGDIWEFSKIVIELVEKTSCETLATFDNMQDAETAYNSYTGENEVYLHF